MAVASVYPAITAITAEFAQLGIPKSHRNPVDQYLYRSIDDVLNRLSPLLAKHRLCVLPRVVDRVIVDRQGAGEGLLVNVTLRVLYTIVSSDDGSSHVVEAFGEALDEGDKGTAKAMSAAYKAAMLQTFCIPVSDAEEPDAHSPRLVAKTHLPAPLQGWDQWTVDIADIIGSCASDDALRRVQERNRQLLQALARERADLYAQLGEAFSARRTALERSEPADERPKAAKRGPGKSRKAQPVPEPALA
jgi:hypothetical protein